MQQQVAEMDQEMGRQEDAEKALRDELFQLEVCSMGWVDMTSSEINAFQ